MSDDDFVKDLWGNYRPLPGRRGRPKHVPDAETIGKVQMALALGWSNDRIANALNISLPTLRKSYKRQLDERELARDQLDLRKAQIVWEQVEKGNVGAINAFDRLVERNDLMLYGQKIKPQTAAKPTKEPKVGKKEAALIDANQPDRGSAMGRLIAERQGKMN